MKKNKFKIKTIDFRSDRADEDFIKSLKNSGFAILYNHGISDNLINNIYKIWGHFFNSKVKHDYLFDKVKQDGYFPMKSENAKGFYLKDYKEFYHIYNNGKIPDKLKTETLQIKRMLKNISSVLLKWIDKLSPIEVKKRFSVPLNQMAKNGENDLLRIIHYPPIGKDIELGSIRAAAHEDINLITILISGSQPGLQVKIKENQWLDVKSDPGWLIINIGDMLQECSGGYYPSTTHRVINPKEPNISRYSIPLFIHPSDEVILSEKYTAKSYLNERLSELGLK